MPEQNTSLCPTCVNSVYCDVWAEIKCKVRAARIYESMTECEFYEKRKKDFKEPLCRCEDCLKHYERAGE